MKLLLSTPEWFVKLLILFANDVSDSTHVNSRPTAFYLNTTISVK